MDLRVRRVEITRIGLGQIIAKPPDRAGIVRQPRGAEYLRVIVLTGPGLPQAEGPQDGYFPDSFSALAFSET